MRVFLFTFVFSSVALSLILANSISDGKDSRQKRQANHDSNIQPIQPAYSPNSGNSFMNPGNANGNVGHLQPQVPPPHSSNSGYMNSGHPNGNENVGLSHPVIQPPLSSNSGYMNPGNSNVMQPGNSNGNELHHSYQPTNGGYAYPNYPPMGPSFPNSNGYNRPMHPDNNPGYVQYPPNNNGANQNTPNPNQGNQNRPILNIPDMSSIVHGITNFGNGGQSDIEKMISDMLNGFTIDKFGKVLEKVTTEMSKDKNSILGRVMQEFEKLFLFIRKILRSVTFGISESFFDQIGKFLNSSKIPTS